jgi:uncharacterized BrkB/YihY/UPF0761 family membrane protein
MAVWALLKGTAVSWSDHKDARLGAALAYYSIFSIGPLIVIAIAIAGLAFGTQAVRGEVATQLQDFSVMRVPRQLMGCLPVRANLKKACLRRYSG